MFISNHSLKVQAKIRLKSVFILEFRTLICEQADIVIMAKEIPTDNQKKMARYAKAMGHPIRMYVLELLSKQSCCYSGDLTEDLPIAKSTLSQHLKELKDAGLIQGEIEAPRIKYCINKENWKEAQILFKKFLSI